MKYTNTTIFLLLLLTNSCALGASFNGSTMEELIIKESEKIVLIREGSSKKDYFFHLDSIAYIEKDYTKVSLRFNIVLQNGKSISIYKKENYSKLLTSFFALKKETQKLENTQASVPNLKTPNIIPPQVPYKANLQKEQQEIESLKTNNSEKIISLDPLDIKESN